MIEAINFGDGATMHFELDNVVAAHTHGLGNTQVIPGNNGDCLLVGQSGGGDTTTLKMRDTTLLDCDNKGLRSATCPATAPPQAGWSRSTSTAARSAPTAATTSASPTRPGWSGCRAGSTTPT